MKTTKKKWWPLAAEHCWILHNGRVVRDIWPNKPFKMRYIFEPFGVYPTRRAAQTALRKIKKFVKEEL